MEDVEEVVARGELLSPFMRFAKCETALRYDLAGSAVRVSSIADVATAWENLRLNSTWDGYGHAPLQQALAEHCGVDEACVVATLGTSLANHLVFATLTQPGDEVVVEWPGYEPINTTAQFLGLRVRTFARRFEDGFQVDPAAVARAVTPATRLIVVCNLHNPTSALTDEATLLEVAAIARRVGAKVLVDEVYLDAALDRAPRSAFHLSQEDFIVTSSLTKAYGLGGLRCGWVLATPELTERIWRINDLFAATSPHIAEQLSVVALKKLPEIRIRSAERLRANQSIAQEFLASRDDLDGIWSGIGTVLFPRLRRGDVDRLHALLRDEYETAIVPGRYFGLLNHFRVGIGGDSDTLREGLRRLGAALDRL